MTEAWGKAVGLNDEQSQALREHHKDCSNTKAALFSTSRGLERELGYLLYATVEFNNREEMLDDQTLRLIMSGWSLARVREEDKKHILQTILPVVEKTANRMALAWERETEELARPYLEVKPELCQDVRDLVQILARKKFLEHMRYEFLGRNSSTEQQPHPHSSCAASIVETGRVELFLREFEEGMGYRPREL